MRLHALLADVEATALKTSSQRVAAFLLAGSSEGDVVLQTSKGVLASKLSLTPETLSRVLRDLSDAGVIRVKGRRIHICDVAGLADRGGVALPV